MYPIFNKDGILIKYMPLDELFLYVYQHLFDIMIKENGEHIHLPFIQNTQFICHRINTLEELENIPQIFGVEIDVRENQSCKNSLILAHDPWKDGISLSEFLKVYKHSTLILNIKSERIEYECLKLLSKFGIENFFFLDSSFPMMTELYKKGEKRFAVRFSEYEPLPLLDSNWVWIDCFTKLPLLICNRKICIVSPELQGRPEQIKTFRQQLIQNNIVPNAICCKFHYIYDWI